MTTPRHAPTWRHPLPALAALLAALLFSADLRPALASSPDAPASLTPASVTPPRAVAGIEGSIEAAASDTEVPTAGLATAVAAALTEEDKLTAADAAEGDFFGYSVSLSGDRALVGAWRDDGGAGPFSGSAYVFAFDGTAWTQEAKLTPDDGAASDFFGISVTLAGDRALVGAYGDDDGALGAGSVYVFAFDGTSWTQQAKLTAGDPGANEFFGQSVSISGDRALIGAVFDSALGAQSGAAYVFAFDGSSWTQQAKLTADGGGVADWFGRSVSLSGCRPR